MRPMGAWCYLSSSHIGQLYLCFSGRPFSAAEGYSLRPFLAISQPACLKSCGVYIPAGCWEGFWSKELEELTFFSGCVSGVYLVENSRWRLARNAPFSQKTVTGFHGQVVKWGFVGRGLHSGLGAEQNSFWVMRPQVLAFTSAHASYGR